MISLSQLSRSEAPWRPGRYVPNRGVTGAARLRGLSRCGKPPDMAPHVGRERPRRPNAGALALLLVPPERSERRGMSARRMQFGARTLALITRTVSEISLRPRCRRLQRPLPHRHSACELVGWRHTGSLALGSDVRFQIGLSCIGRMDVGGGFDCGVAAWSAPRRRLFAVAMAQSDTPGIWDGLRARAMAIGG